MATDTSRLIVNIKVNSKKANDSIKKTTQQMGKFRLSTKGVRRSLGAIRNNLLLVTFAFAGVIASIKRVVETSAKFEAVKTRLVGLTGSVKAAEKAFNTFNKVAATTPFSLEDVVEAGAQLKAFGSDAEKLIKPITNLAAFMGTTATEAANAFGRAFAGGAGAADILREKGILNIIKSSQGLTDLAKTTLPEFREALINTLQDPVVGIEGSTDRLAKTFTGAFSNMWDSVTRLTAATGDRLLPTIGLLVGSIKDNANSMREYIEIPVSQKTEKVRLSINALVRSTQTSNKNQKLRNKLIKDLMVQYPEYFGALSKEKATYEDIGTALANANKHLLKKIILQRTQERVSKIVNEEANALEKLQGKQIDLATIIEKTTRTKFEGNTLAVDSTKSVEEQARSLHKQLKELAKGDFFQGRAFNPTIEAMYKLVAGLREVNSAQIVFDIANKKSTESLAGLNEIMKAQEFKLFQEEVELGIEKAGKGFDKIKKVKEDLREVNEVEIETVKKLTNSYDFLDTSQTAVVNGIQQISSNMATALLNAQNMKEAFVSSIKAMAAEVLSQAAVFGMLNLFTGGTFGAGKSFLDFAFGHTGGKVTNDGIQKFASGGSVMGRDNVPIMAQSGEFIMQRSAVNSIGLQNMVDMNNSGQATGNTINVSINGGIVDQDFIRNELVPALNKEGAAIANI